MKINYFRVIIAKLNYFIDEEKKFRLSIEEDINKGKIKNLCHIKKGDIFRTPINKYHTMLSYSKFVIYHESKVGPFLLKRDSIFPFWAKKFTNEKEIALFKNMIIKKVGL